MMEQRLLWGNIFQSVEWDHSSIKSFEIIKNVCVWDSALNQGETLRDASAELMFKKHLADPIYLSVKKRKLEENALHKQL